jgi:hypothetical protein
VSGRRNPLWARWLVVEDRLCAWIGRLEHKLMRYPPGTRIVPSTFDRQMVRLMAGTCATVALVMLIPRGPLRRTLLLALLLLTVFGILGALALDARRPKPPGPPTPRPPTPKPPAGRGPGGPPPRR